MNERDYNKDPSYEETMAMIAAKKEIMEDVKIMIKECLLKGLAVQMILIEGIPKIEKKHLLSEK